MPKLIGFEIAKGTDGFAVMLQFEENGLWENLQTQALRESFDNNHFEYKLSDANLQLQLRGGKQIYFTSSAPSSSSSSSPEVAPQQRLRDAFEALFEAKILDREEIYKKLEGEEFFTASPNP